MEKYFTPAVGYPFDASPFYKDSTPSGGGLYSNSRFYKYFTPVGDSQIPNIP